MNEKTPDQQLGYGKGPLLAMGIVAAAAGLFGGAGAVAMALDNGEPSIEASDQSSEQADATASTSQTEAASETTPASDPSDATDTQRSTGSSDTKATSGSDSDVSDSSQEGTSEELVGTRTGSSQENSAESSGGRHVADAPVDALMPGSNTEAPGRHVAISDRPVGAEYRIVWGDTLSEIAWEHGVSTQYLVDLNDIEIGRAHV